MHTDWLASHLARNTLPDSQNFAINYSSPPRSESTAQQAPESCGADRKHCCTDFFKNFGFGQDAEQSQDVPHRCDLRIR